MFRFIVKYGGFLKHIPLLPHLFESWMKIWMFFTKPALSAYLDDIEEEVKKWNGVSVSLHKYGGTQFNINKREIGHVHANGILDVLFSREEKKLLMTEGRINNHHVFADSGWISFQIRSDKDKAYALQLIKKSYDQALSLAR